MYYSVQNLKIPGCPCFKSQATKPENLVGLINAWLPIRKPPRLNVCRVKMQSHGVRAWVSHSSKCATVVFCGSLDLSFSIFNWWSLRSSITYTFVNCLLHFPICQTISCKKPQIFQTLENAQLQQINTLLSDIDDVKLTSESGAAYCNSFMIFGWVEPGLSVAFFFRQPGFSFYQKLVTGKLSSRLGRPDGH